MKNFNVFFWMLISSGLLLFSCNSEQEEQIKPERQVPASVEAKLQDLGFNTTEGLFKVEDGYIVEGDIFLSAEALDHMHSAQQLPLASEEQYHTNNLVNGTPRVISVYVDTKFQPKYFEATDAALARYNDEDLNLVFQRVNSSAGADIVI